MRTYELLCIVQPELDEEGMAALNARIADVITGSGGQVLTTEILGRRRLAFPIRKKTEGVYVLTYADMDSVGMAELQRRLRLTEEVLRYLIVRPEEDEIPLSSEDEEDEEDRLDVDDDDDDDDDDDAYDDELDDDTDD